jgi:two-component system, cell cycle sensor histidine kinase and response regulator CckA
MDEPTSELSREELLAELERLRREHGSALQVMTTMGQGLLIVDHNGRIEYANPVYLQMRDYTAEELIGQNIFSLTIPAERDRLHQVFEMRLAGISSSYDMWTARKDGSLIYVRVSGVPRWHNGQVNGMISVITDLTEHKRTEEQLQKSQELYRAITSNFPNGSIFLFDHDLRFTLADGKGLTQAGYSKEKIEGKTLWEVLPPEKVTNLEPYYRAALAGTASIFEINYGDNQTDLVHALPVKDKNGQVIAGMLMSQNISQRKQLEQEMLKVQKLESVGVLAGGIAHDFNNILAATVGYLALARQELAAHAESEQAVVQELLEEAEKSMYRARALTQQLLTFAKGGVPVRKIQALPPLLEQTVNFALRGTNVKADFTWTDDLWLVNIDEGQITQVIHNLVINAVQAMPNGGSLKLNGQNINARQMENPDLTNLLKSGVNYVQVSLEDNGCGIEPELIPKIFDPYFTTKPTGNGLGLATSFSVMRRHEGNITVKSQLGQGTTFYLYLPALPDPHVITPPVPPKVAEKPEQTQVAPKPATKRILVVDDEQAIAKVLSKALTLDGFAVDTVQNGDEAMQFYEEALRQGQVYELVMLDLTLPGGMGGRQIMENLQKLNPDVKAIVISGYSTDLTLANYAEYGFAGALTKPFLLGELRQQVAKVLKT